MLLYGESDLIWELLARLTLTSHKTRLLMKMMVRVCNVIYSHSLRFENSDLFKVS